MLKVALILTTLYTVGQFNVEQMCHQDHHVFEAPVWLNKTTAHPTGHTPLWLFIHTLQTSFTKTWRRHTLPFNHQMALTLIMLQQLKEVSQHLISLP